MLLKKNFKFFIKFVFVSFIDLTAIYEKLN